MIGTLLNDRYRIDSELGRGGMGAVYRAYDQRLKRPLVPNPEAVTTLMATGRFNRWS